MTGPTPPEHDRTEPVDIQHEMQRSFIDYAMSVIVSRALPDVRDGLKPVHRRVLYGMYDSGFRPDRSTVKSSRVVGDVMGNYHPHGDSSIYDTVVRMAQPWSLRYPMIDGQGNFGSMGNDPPAAMRYTECRLTPLAMLMLAGIDENTVDRIPNYDNKTTEPTVLPSRIPNLLVNGSSGIAVGMATNIPPHNLREVAAAVIWSLDNPDATAEELLAAAMERVHGPDFPTGALIVGSDGISDAYRTGRGSIRMRSVVDIEEDAKGRTILVVTELPYQVNPDNLVESIAQLHKDGRIAGIADIADESSDRIGMRIVITMKRDAVAKVVLANLFKHTSLQTSLRRQHALDRRRGAAHAAARPDDQLLRGAPDRRHHPAHPVPVGRGREAGAHPARLRQGAGHAGRGDRADPPVAVRGGIQGRPDGAAGRRRDPGHRDPGHAAAPAGRPGTTEDHRRVGRHRAGHRRPAGDPGRRRPQAADRQGRAHRVGRPSTATTAGPGSCPTTATCPWRT